MIYIIFGMLVGVLILLKIGKRDPQKKEKIDEDTKPPEIKEENHIKPENFLESMNISMGEVKKRQEKILGNLNESERKLFLNYIEENRNEFYEKKKKEEELKNTNNNQTSSQSSQEFSFLDTLKNLIIIVGMGCVIYYYLKI